jgi:hypothetical protein
MRILNNINKNKKIKIINNKKKGVGMHGFHMLALLPLFPSYLNLTLHTQTKKKNQTLHAL